MLKKLKNLLKKSYSEEELLELGLPLEIIEEVIDKNIPLTEIINKIPHSSLEITKKPFVILLVGPNGSGKTTTAAKLAYLLKNQGYKVVLCAADTYRAAAIEQLEEHAKSLNIDIIKQRYGDKPISVIINALNHAKSKNKDVLIVDIAGRQETDYNLMKELEKIKEKINPDLILMVVESPAGYAVYNQIKEYKTLINIDGLIITKLDVDEKGTALFIPYIMNIPIYFVGIGEKYSDLKPFMPSMLRELV